MVEVKLDDKLCATKPLQNFYFKEFIIVHRLSHTLRYKPRRPRTS